jgi:hypothetical protein
MELPVLPSGRIPILPWSQRPLTFKNWTIFRVWTIIIQSLDLVTLSEWSVSVIFISNAVFGRFENRRLALWSSCSANYGTLKISRKTSVPAEICATDGKSEFMKLLREMKSWSCWGTHHSLTPIRYPSDRIRARECPLELIAEAVLYATGCGIFPGNENRWTMLWLMLIGCEFPNSHQDMPEYSILQVSSNQWIRHFRCESDVINAWWPIL